MDWFKNEGGNVLQRVSSTVGKSQPNDVTSFVKGLLLNTYSGSAPTRPNPVTSSTLNRRRSLDEDLVGDKLDWNKMIDPRVPCLEPKDPSESCMSSVKPPPSSSPLISHLSLHELMEENEELYREGTRLAERVVDLERRLQDKRELNEDHETKARRLEQEIRTLKEKLDEHSTKTIGERIKAEVDKVRAEHQREIQAVGQALQLAQLNADQLNRVTTLEEALKRSEKRVAVLEEENETLSRTVFVPSPNDDEIPCLVPLTSPEEIDLSLFSDTRQSPKSSKSEDLLCTKIEEKDEAIRQLNSLLSDRDARLRGQQDLLDLKIQEMATLEREKYLLEKRIDEERKSLNDKHSEAIRVRDIQIQELLDRRDSSSSPLSVRTPRDLKTSMERPLPHSMNVEFGGPSTPPNGLRPGSNGSSISGYSWKRNSTDIDQNAEEGRVIGSRPNVLLGMKRNHVQDETETERLRREVVDLEAVLKAERTKHQMDLEVLSDQFRSSQRMVMYLHELLSGKKKP